MGAFKSAVITTKGQALMAKVIAGTTTFNFTKICTSATTYAVGTDLAGLTNIGTVKQTSLVSSVTKVSGTAVKVSAQFVNTSLGAGYYVKVLGLYAIDPTDGEILYAVAVADETTATADYMPPNNNIGSSSLLVDMVTTVSNASSVTVNIDPSAVATVTQINTLQSQIDDVKGYIGYTASDIYGVEVDYANKTFRRLAGAENLVYGTGFDGINAFGGRKRCNITDGGVITAYYGDTAYTDSGALTQAVTIKGVTYAIGTPVQVMVEQPKFYYKVVPQQLEKISVKEVENLVVNAGATADGNLTITLDGNTFTVGVLATDNTATLVATKIRNASFAGWTTGGSGTTVTFTAITAGLKTAPTFAVASTGVTGTMTVKMAGYVGKGYHIKKASYYVSDVPKAGFKLHPAFNINGVEKDKIYLSAFEGSLYDTSTTSYILDDAQVADFTATTGDKLSSRAGVKPASGLTQDLTRAKTRILATNRGAGWGLHNIYALSVTQLLFLVEYASMDMQAKLGIGVSNKTDDGLTNMAENTGGTSGLGNASGSVQNINNWNVVTYRGEENLYGNIWTWVDGINIEAKSLHNAYVNSLGSNMADDTKTNYTEAGFPLSHAEGYISRFGYSDNDFLFLPTENLGASNLPVGDYFWQNHTYNGFMVALLGGYWNNGSVCGAFLLSVYHASSSRARYLGGRLLYVPQ